MSVNLSIKLINLKRNGKKSRFIKFQLVINYIYKLQNDQSLFKYTDIFFF